MKAGCTILVAMAWEQEGMETERGEMVVWINGRGLTKVRVEKH